MKQNLLKIVCLAILCGGSYAANIKTESSNVTQLIDTSKIESVSKIVSTPILSRIETTILSS